MNHLDNLYELERLVRKTCDEEIAAEYTATLAAAEKLVEAAREITQKHVVSERFVSGYGYCVAEEDIDALREALKEMKCP
jgi:hypothetical protein